MQTDKVLPPVHHPFQGRGYQSLAILLCVLFGIAMIANTQMGGEAEWYWYATFFHNGAKLYADLHLALQPLLILQTDAWIQLFGIKCLVTEIPSVVYVFAFCVAIFLILQESDWPDWQKAVVLAGAFMICLECTAYRFDDFHLVADTFIFYSAALLLMIYRTDTIRQQFVLTAGLGILSGLTITTRLNDGIALAVAAGFCLLFLVRARKLSSVSLFVVAVALTVVVVVKLTGDSFWDYASNSIINAAGANGGGKSIVMSPFRLFPNALHALRGSRWIYLRILVILGAGALVQRYWKQGAKYVVVVQLVTAGAAVFLLSPDHRHQLVSGTFVSFIDLFFIVVNYVLFPVVAIRYLLSKLGKISWDSREILILLPLAELASVSAGTAGTTAVGFLFSQIAMLLLLIPVIQPFRRRARFANATLVTIMALTGLSAMIEKIHNPYSWMLFHSSPMFENRQWYQHPVYGLLYIDRDLLRFVEPICQEIGKGGSKPELLSMPYSYPNYFCNTPPWHGYVQTFFDTSTRSTINQLMRELDSQPPQWIVYERQMRMLEGQESALSHGQPLPHRYLDEMIMQKIATGQWRVVSKSNYLFVDKAFYQDGDGWWIIRTRP